MEKELTLAELKDELPDVKVEFQGKVIVAMIKGRKLRFPRVVLPCGLSFETTWKHLLYSVNNDVAILVCCSR